MSKHDVSQVNTQGIHRFLADGVHYRDLLDIQAATADWSQWCRVWSEFAAAAEARGDAALRQSLTRTAAAEFRRAAHDRKVSVFRRAAPLFDPPLERVAIPFEKTSLPAYLRLPSGRPQAPCVILLGGLDTTKEDYMVVNDLCAARGLATLAFDGPGQGEMLYSMPWRADFERAIYAVLDYLETRPEIDSGRIGIIGRSTGGYYAPKSAAVDARIKAAVVWGAMYHLRNLASIPAATRDGFVFVSRSKSVEGAVRFFECINLEGVASKIRCPLLVVHGGRDTITPLENATRLIREAAGPVETLIWEDSGHCCHDRAHIVRPAMADFMVRHL